MPSPTVPSHNLSKPAQAHLSVEAAAAEAARKFAVIDDMAEFMREADAADGGCTIDDLKLRGFTPTQITLYADDARVLAMRRSRSQCPRAVAHLPHEAAGVGRAVDPRGIMASNA